MAATIPAALRAADISRFLVRAAQVEKAKPVIAYWCNYWVVNQILSKGLHNADDESMAFTMKLMDKLEQTKAEHSQNDAILDDVAGQAYVEQFGLETFQRADNAVRANKASRQTADTFQAAATFLDLLHIWGPLDPDIASKIKFAKYHALRIAKALKAGEDPNLSNPTPEPSPIQEQPPLDPNDPEVQALIGASTANRNAVPDHQPFAKDAPDIGDGYEQRLAHSSALDPSSHPSKAPSLPRTSNQDYSTGPIIPSPNSTAGENYYHSHANELSPLAAPDSGKTGSEGGGYFPSVPHGYSETRSPVLPEAPSEDPGSPPAVELPDPSSLPPSTTANYQSPQPPVYPPTSPVHPDQHPYLDPPVNPQNSLPPRQPAYSPHPPATDLISPPVRPSNPTPITASTHRIATHQARSQPVATPVSYVADEEAIVKAQKHARWAISALNFEDVNTAVKELKGALESLGAT